MADPYVEQLAAELAQRYREMVHKKHTRTWQPTATHATSLGYDCERRIVFARVEPEKVSVIDPELASIFEEGNLHQRDVRAKLNELGAEVLEAERNFRDERLEITGSIDGKLEVTTAPPGTSKFHRRVPVEIKSAIGKPPATQEEWAQSETPLMRRYYAQLQIYLLLTSEQDGLALFKDKATGLWTVVAVELDYAYAEGLLKKAERVRDAVRAYKAASDDQGREAALPRRIPSRSECYACPWKDTICHPEEAEIDPMLVAEDAELAAQLERRDALDAARREWEKLDEKVKQRFKLTSFQALVVGDFVVRKKIASNGAVKSEIKRMPMAVQPQQPREP